MRANKECRGGRRGRGGGEVERGRGGERGRETEIQIYLALSDGTEDTAFSNSTRVLLSSEK